ncbi:hypothetical protein FGB62_160g02 [Gracilaria domingensis]|nr:hypothetical protein FGB62_160g02 [Gracilaria domingensis]
MDRDPQHMEILASLMLYDAAVGGDKKRALRMYRQAIQASNDAWRMFRLAELYASGTFSLKPCFKRAKKWYERAIQVGDLPKAKVALAYALTTAANEQHRNPVRAATLLEEALVQAPNKETLMQLGNLYSEDKRLSNYPRAKQMYQRAMDEFDCRTAMMFLLGLYMLGHTQVPPDHQKALEFCTVQYERTKDSAVLYMLVSLLWSGSDRVPPNRRRAYELCNNEENDTHAVQASLLRYGEEGVVEADIKLARTLCEGRNSVNAVLTYAIILSESSSRRDLKQAEEILRNVVKEGQSYYAWIPLSLRRSAFDLPVDGNPTRVLRCMKRVANCSSLAALNLVSLLLEKRDGKDDCMYLMDYLVKETKEALLARLNIAHLRLGGVATMSKDAEGAVSILESALEVSDDMSARAMLAGALVACNKDWERSVQLWKGVKEECAEDEEELVKVRQLMAGETLRKLEGES